MGLIRILHDCIICFLLLVSIANAGARQESFPEIDESGAPSPAQPGGTRPSPTPDNFDWIQLSSDEWLKGEIKSLFHDELRFESEKLDLLDLDWDDIRQVQGHRLHSVRFDSGITVTGTLKVVDDTVTVDTGDGIREFDRRSLFSIATGESRYFSSWSAAISLSAGIRKGNSDQVDFSCTTYLERFTSRKRFRLDYIGNYNETSGVETANSHRISSNYDMFRTARFFWRPVFGEYFHDPFSNIQNRYTIGAGIGYRRNYTPRTTLDISTGLAYQYLQNVSVEVGENSHSSTPALVLVANYEFEWTDDIDFTADYTMDIVNEDSGTYWHHSVLGLSIDATSHLDLKVSLIWDRTKNPKMDEDGVIPEKDDYHFVVGVVFEY